MTPVPEIALGDNKRMREENAAFGSSWRSAWETSGESVEAGWPKCVVVSTTDPATDLSRAEYRRTRIEQR